MLKSTFDVADLCVKHKVKKVIYSSSASVYGLAQHFPTPETDNPYNNQTFMVLPKCGGNSYSGVINSCMPGLCSPSVFPMLMAPVWIRTGSIRK
jgi:hypothetical protein